MVQSGNLEKETSDTSDFSGLLICYSAPLTLTIHIFSSASEFVQGQILILPDYKYHGPGYAVSMSNAV